jgi:hypothetical protein
MKGAAIADPETVRMHCGFTDSYFFSSVAHVWVPGAKTTGPIVKKFGFS